MTVQSPSDVLRYFEYGDLMPEYHLIASWFWDVAHRIVNHTKSGHEQTEALRILFQARERAIMAKVASTEE